MLKPNWMADYWQYIDGQIVNESGDLVLEVEDKEVAEYLIAVHHKCINMSYVAGQLEIEFPVPARYTA